MFMLHQKICFIWDVPYQLMEQFSKTLEKEVENIYLLLYKTHTHTYVYIYKIYIKL